MNPSTAQAFSAVQAKTPPSSGVFGRAFNLPLMRENSWKAMAGVALAATTATTGMVIPEYQLNTPIAIIAAANTHSQLRRSLAAFDTSAVDFDMVNQLAMENKQSINFLEWFANTTREIYGSATKVVLRTTVDPDTKEPLIEATIFSGLPVGDEFDSKDQELFERIAASGLQNGMQNVVVSHG